MALFQRMQKKYVSDIHQLMDKVRSTLPQTQSQANEVKKHDPIIKSVAKTDA